jgi:hypothetical protein
MIYVVAEALTNAAKHAQASKVNVFVEGKDANIRAARTRLICAHARAKWAGPTVGPTSASTGDENGNEDIRSPGPCWPVRRRLPETGR